MPNVLTLFFQGDYGKPNSHVGMAKIKNLTDSTAIAALKTAIMGLSDCGDAGYSFSDAARAVVAKPGTDVSVDQRLECYFIDTATGNIVSVGIPGPKSSAWEVTTEGKRATSATMTTLQGALQTATGKTLAIQFGKIVDKG